MRFSDFSGTQWPEYAVFSSQPHTTQIGGVYLDDTFNRCVTGTATFTPFNGMGRVRVRIGPHRLQLRSRSTRSLTSPGSAAGAGVHNGLFAGIQTQRSVRSDHRAINIVLINNHRDPDL